MHARSAIPFEDVVINSGDTQTMNMSHLRKMHSKQLFGDAKEIYIAHLGEVYMLTITKQNKLLLTKLKQDFAL